MSVISATDVEKANGVLVIASKDIVTPLAADRAKELGVKIERAARTSAPHMGDRGPSATAKRTRAAGSVSEVTGPSAPRAPAATQSGALYRRGASVPPAILPDRSTNAAAADARPFAAVIGAGHVGAMTALRLAETSLFARIALVDVVPGLAPGLALDMWHSASLRSFTTRIEGSSDLSAIAGADYVVVTAGKPRQPGMSRTDLTGVNAAIIREVAEGIRQYAPSSVVIVVTNPLEEMTHLMAKTTGFSPQRVVGMAGVLDAARFKSLVALTGVARPQDIAAIALGSHGPEMVIPLSQATVNGAPLETLVPLEEIGAIVERTRDSGAEVVKLLQKGSAYFAPAESAAAMVIDMVRESGRVMAACVQSAGAYGIDDTRIGLPVRLGRRGVKEIVTLPLNPQEKAALAKAASSIASRVRELG
jgi:malate dehydrogenase